MRNYAYYGYHLLEGFPPGPLATNTYGSLSEDPADPADPETYLTDVLTGKAVELITQRTPAEQPFFLWLTYLAPHDGAPVTPGARCDGVLPKPAIRHFGAFEGASLPMPPNLNEADVSDKPLAVRRRQRLTEEQLGTLEAAWRCHRESLLAVDEGVGRIADAVEAAGEAENTLVLFTSDNGYMFGEHRFFREKNWPYEESIRVPLMVRGPGFEAGAQVRELAFNVDLAATILDAANIEPGLKQDGRSLIPLAREPERLRGRELLIRGPELRGVRNARFTFVRRAASAGGGSELYDLRRDPFQLQSLDQARRFADERRALRKRLRVLRHCAGVECRRRPRVRLRSPVRGCAARRALVRVAGADVRATAAVRFKLPRGRAKWDGGAPFQVRVPPSGVRDVTARATLVDGRVGTLRATQPVGPDCSSP